MLRLMLIFALACCARAQELTALQALKLLPRDAAKHLARIEARDGVPWPERWYFLVHDPAAPLGLREYAVAEGALKADRALSQFADALKPTDVLGAAVLQFDSDGAAALAARYAIANQSRLGVLHYEFGRYGENGTAAWRLTVLDQRGDQSGTLIISARDGSVIRHDGFTNKPADTDTAAPPQPPAAVSAIGPGEEPPPKPTVLKPAVIKQPPKPPTPRPVKPAKVATPTPAPTPAPKPVSPFRRLFGSDGN